MADVRSADVRSQLTEFRYFSSLTLEEFQCPLVRPCCMNVERVGERRQYSQPHLLFKRYGHNSDVQTRASGSERRQRSRPQSPPRFGWCAIDAHRRSRVCSDRSMPLPVPADSSRWISATPSDHDLRWCARGGSAGSERPRRGGGFRAVQP